VIRLERTCDVSLAEQAHAFLADLDRYYPNFGDWYRKQVLPGIARGQDAMVLAWDGDRLAGVALGKRTAAETKLRCVRVGLDWANSGLGLRLIERMFEELETQKPACTVSEEMLHQYSRPFVNRYGFELSSVDKGRYRRGKLEYAFNGG